MYSGRMRISEPWSKVDGALDQMPRRPQRLAHTVVEDVLGRILRGDLPAGSVLPTEPELGSHYGVSRNVIREAVKSLEEKGMVRARQGFGTTVNPEDEWNILDPVVLSLGVKYDKDLQFQKEVVSLRVALEGQMAAQAAEQAVAEDIAELHDILDRMSQKTGDPKEYLDLDFEFHGAIMKISGNRLARRTVRNVHEQVRRQLQGVLVTDSELAVTHAEHRAMFEAISSKDPAAAQAAVVEHILSAWSRRTEQP